MCWAYSIEKTFHLNEVASVLGRVQNWLGILKKCAFLDPRFKGLDPFVCNDERCDIEAVKLDIIEFVNEEELHNDSAENLTNETKSNPPKKRKLEDI